MTARELGEPLIELRGVAKDYVSAAGTVRAMPAPNLCDALCPRTNE